VRRANTLVIKTIGFEWVVLQAGAESYNSRRVGQLALLEDSYDFHEVIRPEEESNTHVHLSWKKMTVHDSRELLGKFDVAIDHLLFKK
jgi:hypothetical protein